MARWELRFGVPVLYEGQEYGTMEAVALAPAAPRWEALLVRRGLLRRSEGVVPRAAVRIATELQVAIAAPPEVLSPAPAWRIVREGAPVRAGGGRAVGRVVLLLADDDGRLRHLVLQRRPLGARLMVPAEALRAVGPDGVAIDLTPAAIAALPPYRSDSDLAVEVRRRLGRLPPVAQFEDRTIRVSVTDGIVTLTGHVTSRLRATQVAATAAAVPGALGVDDRLVCDDELERAVAAALAADPRTRLCTLDPEVRHGVVTLSGRAPDAATAEAAAEVAASVPAVRGVVNRIIAPGFVPDTVWSEWPAIGEPVYAEDGLVGTIERVVIDPRRRRLAGVTVTARAQAGDGPGAPVVQRTVFVPVERIQTVTDVAVFVAGSAGEVARGPLAADRTLPAPAGWSPPFPYRPGEVSWPAQAAAPAPAPDAG
jgi:osmotically-inducible protein OsmY/sporulation protein YlmC with PRC-barrel domain